MACPEGKLSPWAAALPRKITSCSVSAGRSRCTNIFAAASSETFSSVATARAAARRSLLRSAAGGYQGKSPDHSRQLDRPHRRVQPPWPVIDPAEHSHISARDQPVGYEHSAHDHHAQPGYGDKCVGPPALVRPAVRGLGPPPGQPPAQVLCPASLARGCWESRLAGCICRHRCHTCPAGSSRSGQDTAPPALRLGQRCWSWWFGNS